MYKIDLTNLENALQERNSFIVITRDYKNVRKFAYIGNEPYPLSYTSHQFKKLLIKSNTLIKDFEEEDYELDIGYAADENTLDKFLGEGYLLITKSGNKFSLTAKFIDEENEPIFYKNFYATNINKLLNEALKWTDSFYLDFLGEP